MSDAVRAKLEQLAQLVEKTFTDACEDEHEIITIVIDRKHDQMTFTTTVHDHEELKHDLLLALLKVGEQPPLTVREHWGEEN